VAYERLKLTYSPLTILPLIFSSYVSYLRLFAEYHRSYEINDDELRGKCSTLGRNEHGLENYGLKTREAETIWGS
jgi:hypothetical protein